MSTTIPIPIYLAYPTRETNGENVRWRPGQKARFLRADGGETIVTIMTGDLVTAEGAPPGVPLIEVTFDEEGGVAYCVRAAQLRLR